jgi:ABC-type Zn uptake system ZnuABC Zn-binding protein ZnuA
MPAIALLALLLVAPAAAGAAEPLRVCATTPDLASLVHAVGGSDVDVTVFAKGTEDPHFVEPRPSFVKALSQAELLVVNGLDLEVGWLPPLLQTARNGRVLPGGRGHLDASRAVEVRGAPAGAVDRSMGDVHPFGNPHHLLDPVNGLRVADAIRGALDALRPESRPAFGERYEAFRARLGAAMLGERLASKYPFEKVAELAVLGRLDAFLETQGESALLGGWLGTLRAARGTRAIGDHDVWAYFAHRFGIRIVGLLEPRPGYPPTTRHLESLIETMRDDDVPLVLASAYYDPKHARFVAERTGATVVAMANQVGSRPGTDDYVALIEHDVRAIARALAERDRS